jgi:DNA-binding transcriptional MerR regulator
MSYPITIVRRVRELREAEWSIAEIQKLVERETGHRPSRNTIWSWLNEGAEAARRRRRPDPRLKAATFAFPGQRSTEWKLGRVRLLHDAGLPCRAIAAVMRCDFGDDLTEHEVRGAIRYDRVPLRWRATMKTRTAA